MGTCCSTVPTDHSYSSLSVEIVPNDIPQEDDSIDNDEALPLKCEIEVHSESRSVSDRSESKESDDGRHDTVFSKPDENAPLINDNIRNRNIDDAPLMDDNNNKRIKLDDTIDITERIKDENIPKNVYKHLDHIQYSSPSPKAEYIPKSNENIIKSMQQNVADINEEKDIITSEENITDDNTETVVSETKDSTEKVITHAVQKNHINPPQSDDIYTSITQCINDEETDEIHDENKAKPTEITTNEAKSDTDECMERNHKDPMKSIENIKTLLNGTINEEKDESKDDTQSKEDMVMEERDELSVNIVENDGINDNEYKAIDLDNIKEDIVAKRKKSTHSLYASMRIIDEYNGNEDIHRLRTLYYRKTRVKPSKSRHTVKRSMEIIAGHKNMEILKLKKKYKGKRKKKKKKDTLSAMICAELMVTCTTPMKRRKSTHSVKRSSVIINEYKGNDDISILKKKYMEYHRNSIVDTGRIIPPKPTNIDAFMNERTDYFHRELCEYICEHTHYVGIAEFEDHKELCVEIKFASNVNGLICGKRRRMHKGDIDGNGKIYRDVIWNSDCNEYEGCIRFEWMDIEDDMVTRLIFNTAHNYLDMQHLYFEGKCYEYRAGLIADDVEMDGIKDIRKGVFNMVCVSMRKRNISKRDGLLNYHKVDIWRMNDEELQRIPKYIKCMNITSVKMHQIYAARCAQNID